LISQTSSIQDGLSKIVAQPLHDANPSIAGLSSGFIVDVFFGANIQDFAWVGVQSKETRFARKGIDYAKDITFIDSRVVVHVIDEYIGELQRQNPDIVKQTEHS